MKIAHIMKTVSMKSTPSFRGKPAPCGKYSKTFCTTKFKNCEDCKQCSLVKHRFEPLYKYINGVKHKRCPRCGEYYPMHQFRPVQSRGRLSSSWCKVCFSEYNLEKYKNKKQIYPYIVQIGKNYSKIADDKELRKLLRHFIYRPDIKKMTICRINQSVNSD